MPKAPFMISRGKRGCGCGKHVHHHPGSSRPSALPSLHVPPGGWGRRSQYTPWLLEVVPGPGCLSSELHRPVTQSLGTRHHKGCHVSPAPAGAVLRARVRPGVHSWLGPVQIRARLPTQIPSALEGGRPHCPTGFHPGRPGKTGGCLGRGMRESKAREVPSLLRSMDALCWVHCVFSLAADGWLCCE